jgi:hypothetical protein
MKKIYLSCLVLLACGWTSVGAQDATKMAKTETSTPAPATANPKAPTAKTSTAKGAKSPIKNVDAIYDIRLGAYAKGLSDNAFNNLKDLGLLKVVSNENGLMLVYLGSYMGKTSANKILAMVKSRGYKTAYLEQSKTQFSTAEGIALTHTFQFCSVKRLDVRRVGNIIAQDISLLDKLFISYEGGYNQMSLGLLAPGFSSEIETYKSFAATHGFTDAFFRTFRPTPSGYTPPTPNVEPPKVEPAPTPAPAPKPAPTAAKDDKMSGDKTTTTAAKNDKMTGGKTTTTAAKNDKMSGGK